MTAQECSQLLLSKNNILIITHTNPDGDTLCSAAALCSALRRAGKRANLFRNPAVTTKYMPHVEKYFAPKSFKSKYIVSVDVATEKMFAEGFDGAIDLCIDHHPTNSHYAKKELVCPDKAACGEIVLAVIKEMCGGITQEEADLLYIAVTTDTGCFQYLNTNAATFRAAAELLEYGADIVVHSATKFIGGHGTTIGGVIVDSGKFDWEGSGKFPSLTEPNPSYHGISFTKAVGPAAFVTKIRAILLRDTGATISPFHAFFFLQGLETLSLRVERHVENALKVVEYLNNHPQVEKVHHPSVSDDPEQKELYAKYFPNGGGSIFTFEIKGDAQKAKGFIDNLELFSLLANVADVKSLVIHPATTTHSQCTEEELLDQGIKPNTIRLSIGTENIDDIIQDLDEAFKAVQ